MNAQSDRKNNSQHGGKRKGAGRPRQAEILAKDNTKTIRVTYEIAENIKSGVFQTVMQLVDEYKQEIANNPKSLTSPRYDKLREFLVKIDKKKTSNP